MSYRDLDFDADKPIQYKELRYKMALKYEDEDVSLFGPARPFLLQFPQSCVVMNCEGDN